MSNIMDVSSCTSEQASWVEIKRINTCAKRFNTDYYTSDIMAVFIGHDFSDNIREWFF